MLIWIDDAHFLDTRSFEVLGPLIRDLQGKPVLFLLSGTTAPPSPDLDGAAERVGRDAEGAVVALGPLDEAEMKRMAKAALPDWPDEAIDRLLRRLMRDTGGYPLLAVDMLHALRLSLDLPEEAGTWPAPTHTLDDSFPGALPEPLVAAIRVGYRRLSADAQKVLAVAALIEGRATPDVLRRATELDEQAILDALDELEWRRWLAAEPRGYTFIAHLHRDVILTDLLTRGQRQRLEDRLA